jgi:hypothetical protein
MSDDDKKMEYIEDVEALDNLGVEEPVFAIKKVDKQIFIKESSLTTKNLKDAILTSQGELCKKTWNEAVKTSEDGVITGHFIQHRCDKDKNHAEDCLCHCGAIKKPIIE